MVKESLAPAKIFTSFSIFGSHPELHYGLSTRLDGNMNFKVSGDQERINKQNRQRYLTSEGVTNPTSGLRLVHGKKVVIFDNDNSSALIEADGGLTGVPGLSLVITIGDCFPVFIYDPHKKVIGLIHSGWRGIAKNITVAAIKSFVENYHSSPEDLLLGIGPGLQHHHFEFNKNAEISFGAYPKQIRREAERTLVDLPGIIAAQAKSAGVTQVESCNICTFCQTETYFSYRRDQPPVPEVMLAYMGLNGPS